MNLDDKMVNIVLVGQSSVGKTCLARRFIEGRFEETASTIGMDFSKKKIDLDGKSVIVRIWDTAGMERYSALNETYYSKAEGVIIVFDVTNEDSFRSLNNFLATAKEKCVEGVPVFLVANKSDLELLRQVSKEDALEFAKSVGKPLIELSCLENNENSVQKMFNRVCKKALELVLKREEDMEMSDVERLKRMSLKLIEKPAKEEKKKCC